jgi:hypothetical protein
VSAQVLKERLALTGFRDGKHLMHRWRDDPEVALPEVLRMAVSQVGIVPFHAQRLKRPHILPERLRTAEPRVELVDLCNRKNGIRSMANMIVAALHTIHHCSWGVQEWEGDGTSCDGRVSS